MNPNTKKFLLIAAIAVAVTLVVSNPTGAAALVSGLASWAGDALSSFGEFVTSIDV